MATRLSIRYFYIHPSKKMDFMISKEQASLSEVEKVKLSEGRRDDANLVTTHLYLKSSSSTQTSQTLDKDVVLQRIRHHKCLHKVRSTFQALASSSSYSSSGKAGTISDLEHKWLELNDAFSAP
ncbi:hypothetical protein F0562_006515 [Nyssa sinensis]|uniref:Uncharacterized protein n=1 Tax=Nyssa sinensis TaxID=561372 RepID=A0A5J5ANH1_9ASTE|nr:hypothetical protein F0562_006515 [Nyssa sinensis]